MTQRLAVAVVHGVGSQKEDFAKAFASRLRARFASEIEGLVSDPTTEIQIRGVYWAKVLSDQEQELEGRFHLARLRWGEARNIMIDLGGDALAYQLNRQADPQAPPSTYEKIHMTFAGALKALVADTDAEAPLCVISHSLGTVIASNYLWDIQRNQVPTPVSDVFGGSPLEEGKTLTNLYTMGSPIAVWSLRYPGFGKPIDFPSPGLLPQWQAAPREWVNLYDEDDVIAYPLKCLNDAYDASVSEDLDMNVGNILTMWNPAAHTGYWTDGGVVRRLAEGLARVWRAVNGH